MISKLLNMVGFVRENKKDLIPVYGYVTSLEKLEDVENNCRKLTNLIRRKKEVGLETTNEEINIQERLKKRQLCYQVWGGVITLLNLAETGLLFYSLANYSN